VNDATKRIKATEKEIQTYSQTLKKYEGELAKVKKKG
jgi:hypothetical protein